MRVVEHNRREPLDVVIVSLGLRVPDVVGVEQHWVGLRPHRRENPALEQLTVLAVEGKSPE